MKIHHLVSILIIVLLQGCGSYATLTEPYSTLGPVPLAEMELLEKLANSPEIQRLANDSYVQRRSPDEIVIYHMQWHLFNSPNALPNWRKLYSTGPDGNPNRSFKKLARVLVYQEQPDDRLALDHFKIIAAEMGGDAIVDSYRKPLSTKEGTRYTDTYLGPAGIVTTGHYNRGVAWVYHGIVVRFKNR